MLNSKICSMCLPPIACTTLKYELNNNNLLHMRLFYLSYKQFVRSNRTVGLFSFLIFLNLLIITLFGYLAKNIQLV
jgi:hypothetical protein